MPYQRIREKHGCKISAFADKREPNSLNSCQFPKSQVDILYRGEVLLYPPTSNNILLNLPIFKKIVLFQFHQIMKINDFSRKVTLKSRKKNFNNVKICYNTISLEFESI